MAKQKPILKKYALIYNIERELEDGKWFWRSKPDTPFKTYEDEKYLKGMENLYDFEEYCGTGVVEATNMLEAKIKALKWLLEMKTSLGCVYVNLTKTDVVYLGFKCFMDFHEEDNPNEKINEFKDFIFPFEIDLVRKMISLYQEDIKNKDLIKELINVLSSEMQDFFHSWLFHDQIQLFYLDILIR